jgi:hypothetical protein
MDLKLVEQNEPSEEAIEAALRILAQIIARDVFRHRNAMSDDAPSNLVQAENSG